MRGIGKKGKGDTLSIVFSIFVRLLYYGWCLRGII
jgi:hypothetical protein